MSPIYGIFPVGERSGAGTVFAPAANGYPAVVFDMTDPAFGSAFVEFRNAKDYSESGLKHLKVRVNDIDYKIPLWSNANAPGGPLRLSHGFVLGHEGDKSTERRISNGVAAPTSGNWAAGDIVFDRSPWAGVRSAGFVSKPAPPAHGKRSG